MNKNILLFIIICSSLHGMEKEPVLIDYENWFIRYNPTQLGQFLSAIKDRLQQTAPGLPLTLNLGANMFGYKGNQKSPQENPNLLAQFFKDIAGYHIIKLNIYRNLLEEVPEALTGIPTLQELDLSHNDLKTIPKSLLEIPSLTHLNLSQNHLSCLPEKIDRTENSPTLTVFLGTQIPKHPAPGQPRSLCPIISGALLYHSQLKIDYYACQMARVRSSV